MIKLLRTIGAAVVLGLGARAGSELYDTLRKHTRRKNEKCCHEEHPETGAAEASDIEDEDVETKTARLKAERQRINRELERLRRKQSRRSS